MIKKIGIVLEQESDAKKMPNPMAHLYHWRVPEEIEAISQALVKLGYEVIHLGTPEDLALIGGAVLDQVDFIFNLSVGFISRSRLAKGPVLYELLGLPYSGADPYTKMTTQNKHLFKAFMDKMGYATPNWAYLHHPDELARLSIPEFPIMVKPAYEGSSVGIHGASKVTSIEELTSLVTSLYEELEMPILLERFIVGSELKLGIIGNGEDIESYLMEDVDQDGHSLGQDFLYYDVKTKGHYDKVFRDIDLPEYAPLLKMCQEVYHLFEPVDYGTFDIRRDLEGHFYIIEFNADATLHPHRTLAKCCELSGVNYNTLIGKIMRSALIRQEG